MASSTPHTIVLSPNGAERPLFELPANGNVLPGELLEITTDEDVDQHSVANGTAVPWFAVENPYSGHTSGAAIDHAYADTERVRVVHAQPGDILYAYIEASATLVFGRTLLASNGAGALQAIVPDGDTVTKAVVAVAWQDATIGGAAARAKVKII